MKLFTIVCVTVVLATGSTGATEYPWSEAARNCGYTPGYQWTSAAWCAVNTYYHGIVPPPVRDAAIVQIYHEREQARCRSACGNPIDQVFFRVGGVR